MHILVLWNNRSPNFNQNEWVRENGTSTVVRDTFEEIMDLFHTAMGEPYIVSAFVDSHVGCVNWVRNDADGCEEYLETEDE